jgi:biotin carboxylase
MSQDNTILIIGGKPKVLRKAKALGLNVVHFQRMSQFSAEHKEHTDAAVLLEYTDLAKLRPLAQAARTAWDFGFVLSLTEPGLMPAAEVNDLLGLAGTSIRVSELFVDKWLMRQRLAEVGFPSVPAALVIDPDSLRDFGAAHGFPFIVKPTRGTGSVGVSIVRGPDSIDKVWRKVVELRTGEDFPWLNMCVTDEFIMEAYVAGPEYSVEAFSFDGNHIVVAITEKTVWPEVFVESGHAIPARLPSATEEAIEQTVTGFLDALGLRNGPTHTELRIASGGPVVIESNNRVGGDKLNELVEAVYGIDLSTYAIGWPFRLVEELTSRPLPKRAAATRFLIADPGRVTGLGQVSAVRAHPEVIDLEVNVSIGDVVEPLRDSGGRLGQIVATGTDTAAAISTCEEALTQLVITTEPLE